MKLRNLITARSSSSRNTLRWVDGFARWTIRHAARRAPPPLAERLEEEWLADLQARYGAFSRLRLGLGCCWAVTVIAHEHGAPRVAAASTTGTKIMTSYARPDSSLFSKRTTTLIVIAGAHIALIYAFANGLGRQVAAALPEALQAYFPDEVKTHPLPPPEPTQPNLTQPRLVDVPQPPINLEFVPEVDTIRGTIDTPPLPPQVDTTPEQPVKVVNRVMGGLGKDFPNMDDFYPAASRRLGETGTSLVRVCVDARGRLTSAPTIAQTSGSARLDEGAMKLARAGSGRYRPTLEEGRPVDSCYAFTVRFRLQE